MFLVVFLYKRRCTAGWAYRERLARVLFRTECASGAWHRPRWESQGREARERDPACAPERLRPARTSS